MDHTRNAYRVWVGKVKGKRLIGRPGVRKEYITMNHRKAEWDCVGWFQLLRIGKRGGLLLARI